MNKVKPAGVFHLKKSLKKGLDPEYQEKQLAAVF